MAQLRTLAVPIGVLAAVLLFLVANRKDLSAEESPLFMFVVRDLAKAGIDPIAASVP